MTPDLEFEGKNVEKAVRAACEQLNIPREKLKYDVISYGSTGIFGLVGTKKAKIHVILPETYQEPPSGEMDLEKEKERLVDEIIPPAATSTEKEDLETQAPVREAEIHTFPETPVALGREVLQRIIDFVTTGAEILVEEDSERISFKVEGGNSALLIGKRGQTLEAIQYLVEKIVNKRSEGRIRIQIDIEGYLEARRQSLKRLSARLAEKAKRTGKPVTIGQLNAHDRRIVHLALKEDKRVRTQSVGDGYYRKLVIFPRKYSSRKRRSDAD